MKKGCEIFLIAVVLAILVVLVLQFVEIMKQNEILEDSLIPNKPEISVFSRMLVNPIFYYDYLVNLNTQYINCVGVLNIGKTTVPYVNLTIEDTEYFEKTATSYTLGEKNISAMESKEIYGSFEFKLKDEAVSSFEPGVYPLKFRVDCSICKKPVSYDSFNICIYKTSPTVDCGPEWHF